MTTISKMDVSARLECLYFLNHNLQGLHNPKLSDVLLRHLREMKPFLTTEIINEFLTRFTLEKLFKIKLDVDQHMAEKKAAKINFNTVFYRPEREIQSMKEKLVNYDNQEVMSLKMKNSSGDILFVSLILLHFYIKNGDFKKSLLEFESATKRILAIRNSYETDRIYSEFCRAVGGLSNEELQNFNFLPVYDICRRKGLTFSTSTLINNILGHALENGDFDKAIILSKYLKFPENGFGIEERTKYDYFMAKIHALNKNYKSAKSFAVKALSRISSRNSTTAKNLVEKLNLVISLLLSCDPRSLLILPELERDDFEHYKTLFIKVKNGEISAFKKILSQNSEKFQTEGLFELCLRLENLVRQMCLKNISRVFSKINPFENAPQRFYSAKSGAELKIALEKAVEGGFIKGEFCGQFYVGEDSKEIYCTERPREIFEARIGECFKADDVVKDAYRYKEEDEAKAEEHLKRLQRVQEFVDALENKDNVKYV